MTFPESTPWRQGVDAEVLQIVGAIAPSEPSLAVPSADTEGIPLVERPPAASELDTAFESPLHEQAIIIPEELPDVTIDAEEVKRRGMSPPVTPFSIKNARELETVLSKEELSRLHKRFVTYFRRRLRPLSGGGVPYEAYEDLAQEVWGGFYTTYQERPLDCTRPGSFEALMFSIAGHKLADHYRAYGKNREDPSDSEDLHMADSGDFTEEVARKDIVSDLVSCLATNGFTLEEESRTILFYDSYSPRKARELAEIFGTTEGAMRLRKFRLYRRVHRALQRLPDVKTLLGIRLENEESS